MTRARGETDLARNVMNVRLINILTGSYIFWLSCKTSISSYLFILTHHLKLLGLHIIHTRIHSKEDNRALQSLET